jgi:FtsP/CotA-like multicopper oxidase with cupredoxin domain
MDGHPFTVITTDFIPIRPWVTSHLTITIGQRYDIIIDASQAVDNYWFRVAPNTACGSNSIIGKVPQIGAILHYEGASDANPTSQTNTTLRIDCNDEAASNLIPLVPRQVPSSVIANTGRLDTTVQAPNKTAPLRWLINGTPHMVDWNNPTLETVLDGSDVFLPNSNVYPMPQVDGWYLWVIQSSPALRLAHPMHLHGHDFYILDSKANAVWNGSTAGLDLTNPTRRDTAVLPAAGYLLIAFLADNPGMWIMHCHIAWHASQGFSMQFGERYSDLRNGALGDVSEFRKGCDEWDGYWYEGNPEKPYNQTDSGI